MAYLDYDYTSCAGAISPVADCSPAQAKTKLVAQPSMALVYMNWEELGG